MEGCSGGIGGNSNSCHDDGGKGNGGSEGYEDQQQQRRQHDHVMMGQCQRCHDNADAGEHDTDKDPRQRGIVLPTLPDGRHGAWLCLAATAPCRQDNDDGH